MQNTTQVSRLPKKFWVILGTVILGLAGNTGRDLMTTRSPDYPAITHPAIRQLNDLELRVRILETERLDLARDLEDLSRELQDYTALRKLYGEIDKQLKRIQYDNLN